MVGRHVAGTLGLPWHFGGKNVQNPYFSTTLYNIHLFGLSFFFFPLEIRFIFIWPSLTPKKE